MIWIYVLVYVVGWWLTSLLALRRIAARGQRELDRQPATRKVLRCTRTCEYQDTINRGFTYHQGSHAKACYRQEPRPQVYERTNADALTAAAWGVFWIPTLLLWSISLAPKTRVEKNAALRQHNIQLQQELAEAQARYEALEKA